jgi:hypothetical protein
MKPKGLLPHSQDPAATASVVVVVIIIIINWNYV